MNLNPQLIIQIVGLVFIVLGVSVRAGWWKKWYWNTRGGVYGYVPMGLLFLVYANENKVIQYVNNFALIAIYVILAIMVVYLSLRPPRWIKPTWISWIEELPASTQKVLRNNAKENDEWMEYVHSREVLHKWAKQLKK